MNKPTRGKPPAKLSSADQRKDNKNRARSGKAKTYSKRLVAKSVASAKQPARPRGPDQRAETAATAAKPKSHREDARQAHPPRDDAQRSRPPRDNRKPGQGLAGAKFRPRPPVRKGDAPARTDDAPGSGSPTELMRIAKAMARAGLCSRRDAERWIADGRVSVNGRLLDTPACDVGPGDRVLVDGAALPAAAPAQLWRYHKPRGLVTTHADPEGRPTVFDALPADMPRVVSIGRLDYNTEGLLLLTNDGALARHLELPATGWLRRYRVRGHGRVSQSDLDALKEGVTIDGVRYGGIEAVIDSVQAGNMWLTISIREGKNREVRRILSSMSLDVNRLIRVSYGPFQLMDLAPGDVEPVKRRVLADQLGPAAAQFGLTGAIDGYKARQARLTTPDKRGGKG